MFVIHLFQNIPISWQIIFMGTHLSLGWRLVSCSRSLTLIIILRFISIFIKNWRIFSCMPFKILVARGCRIIYLIWFLSGDQRHNVVNNVIGWKCSFTPFFICQLFVYYNFIIFNITFVFVYMRLGSHSYLCLAFLKIVRHFYH